MPIPPATTFDPIAVPQLGQPNAPGQTQATNTNANPNPQNQLVGVDSAQFTGQGNPTLPTAITVTFPNLPVRNQRNNPLSALGASRNRLYVQANRHLLLTVFVQGTNGAPGTIVTAKPQALTTAGVVVPGPFLGSENFETFQAVVTIANSPLIQTVTGSVVAHLHLAQGS
jgi:hypothetical protein